jgi:hypothetical protein
MSSPHSSTWNKPLGTSVRGGAIGKQEKGFCTTGPHGRSGEIAHRRAVNHILQARETAIATEPYAASRGRTVIVFRSPLGNDRMLPRKLVEYANPLRASAARRERAIRERANAITSVLRRRTVGAEECLSSGRRSAKYNECISATAKPLPKRMFLMRERLPRPRGCLLLGGELISGFSRTPLNLKIYN